MILRRIRDCCKIISPKRIFLYCYMRVSWHFHSKKKSYSLLQLSFANMLNVQIIIPSWHHPFGYDSKMLKREHEVFILERYLLWMRLIHVIVKITISLKNGISRKLRLKFISNHFLQSVFSYRWNRSGKSSGNCLYWVYWRLKEYTLE